MDEVLLLMPILIFGIFLGIFCFGGLWLTLSHLSSYENLALSVLASFLGRSAICILCFCFMARIGLLDLIFGLAGFILVKFVLIRRLGHCVCFKESGQNAH
jgi:F1F0 ATPase subunit 2